MVDHRLAELGISPSPRVAIALDVSREGFGLLEHLGDAILEAAVARHAYCAGLGPADAIAAATNDALDEVFDRMIGDLARQRTGDVIEALIGAVHLDAGFEAAAVLATAWCLPAAGQTTSRGSDGRWLRFIGSTVLDATIADHLARRRPTALKRWLHAERLRLVSGGHLLDAAKSLGVIGTEDADNRAMDELQESLAGVFLERGWEPASRLTARLIKASTPSGG